MADQCECVQCCDGEHAGECAECAGWGDRCTEELSGECEHCGGSGICPMCHGALRPTEESPR